jgi:aminopeptidase
MTKNTAAIWTHYAALLTTYCLNAQAGERILVQSTPLAEPLFEAVYTQLIQKGCYPEIHVELKNSKKTLLASGNDAQFAHTGALHTLAIQTFDAILTIDAPYDRKALKDIAPGRISAFDMARAPRRKQMSERSHRGEIRWCICVFPTAAGAAEAEMSLSEYEDFVFSACFLNTPDATSAWRQLSQNQQGITDRLNRATQIHYLAPHLDIRFSTLGRRWINSDGKRNMPSGEVFTSPVEDSVNGHIAFTYPVIYTGKEISGIRLKIVDGTVVHWEAQTGQDTLDAIFTIPGANRIGEMAIGLNHNIRRFSKNILFDEKMAGTVHMAIGASYPEAGGKNESGIHLDFITDMPIGSRITADGTQIYQDGAIVDGL